MACGQVPSNYVDHTGKKFSRLTVLSRAADGKNWKVRWNCLCECGNLTIVRAEQLVAGHTRSCGCLQKDMTRRTGLARRHDPIKKTASDVFGQYRRSARERKIRFSLDRAYFESMIYRPCFYCGVLGGNTHNGVKYNGLDRQDPAKGYLSSNLVPCCGNCNYAKLNRPADEFIAWIHATAKHLRSKNV